MERERERKREKERRGKEGREGRREGGRKFLPIRWSNRPGRSTILLATHVVGCTNETVEIHRRVSGHLQIESAKREEPNRNPEI